MKLEFTKDICGNDILQDITGRHQVMMEWERPYMEKCIEYLDPSGSVLEIGFGLGYSARKLCSYKNVKMYTVIECSPVVWEKFEAFKKELKKERPELTINIIKGRWEDLLCKTEVYDGIFFDDYNGNYSLEASRRYFKFLYELVVNKHTKKGTKIGCYSNNPLNISVSIFNIKNYEYDIEIPKYCRYANGAKMCIPIITQILDYNEDKADEIKEKVLEAKVIGRHFKIINVPKKCTCNTIIINNFYNNVNSTRLYMESTKFIDGYSEKKFINDSIKEHIQGYLNVFSKKIHNFSNEKNGRCKISTIKDNYKLTCNSEFKWKGILFLSPDADIDCGIDIYEYIGSNFNKNLDIDKNDKWRVTDTIGNVFNRLVLIPGFIYYKLKLNTTKKCLIQEFYFDTEN